METMILIILALSDLFGGISVQAQAGRSPQSPSSSQSDEAEISRRFQRWMASVRKLAPRYRYHIRENDEDWEEWFWLYFFTEGVSPQRALATTVKWDRELARRRSRARQKAQK